MLLCDVSGSMEQYSRFLIHIIYAMHQELNQLDVAVFSTHMTMITDCLNTDNINDSLEKVTKTAHDWAGGTDIGQCLREFNHYLSREISASRTILVILSDGWDRGNALIMSEEMKRLHLWNHRGTGARLDRWVRPNPLRGGSGAAGPVRAMGTADTGADA